MADAFTPRRPRSVEPGFGPWGCPGPPGGARGRTSPVVVHKPFSAGGRQVSLMGQVVGVATCVADVLAVVRRVGVIVGHEEAGATPLIEWRGGGVDRWG